jgi:flagellar hook-associated protein 3 FlgL
MRISTIGYQTSALAQMEQVQSDLAKTQSQLSTGKKIQSAADDPAGEVQIVTYGTQLSASQQYVTNGNAAMTRLNLEDQALTDTTHLLQSARDLAVEANDASLTDSQRQQIAVQLQQQLQNLLSIANQKDANGDFLFSGFAARTQPFSQSGSSVVYAGDQGARLLQTSSNQRIADGDSGFSVFMNVPSGNGTFLTTAAATNTGAGTIDAGSVTDPTAWVPGTYTVQFTSATTWQVVDASNNVVTQGNYTDGGTIAFNGVQVAVSGTPAVGDQFTVTPSSGTDMFGTLSGLATTLNTPTTTAAARAQLATKIGAALQQIDTHIDHLGQVQASVGTRVNTIQTTQASAQTQQTNMQKSISQLSDVDYAAAITQLDTEQLGLQAAQQSYALLAKLSLFNYIS